MTIEAAIKSAQEVHSSSSRYKNIVMLKPSLKKYTRRTNSNGEDVAPTLTASISKGVQNQLDFGGGYVIDYFRAINDVSSEHEKESR